VTHSRGQLSAHFQPGWNFREGQPPLAGASSSLGVTRLEQDIGRTLLKYKIGRKIYKIELTQYSWRGSILVMNDTKLHERLVGTLQEAEKAIQEIIAVAAREGDYATVDAARNTAVDLRRLHSQLDSSQAMTPKTVGAKAAPASPSRQSGGSANTARADRRGKKAQYPRFETYSDTLVRVGWSKKKRQEYSHRAPRHAFDTIVSVMARMAQSTSSPVMAETLIDELGKESCDPIPSYQVYAILGFLSNGDAIQQAGREGYRLPRDIDARANSLWPL
jgi:hypothetical protein